MGEGSMWISREQRVPAWAAVAARASNRAESPARTQLTGSCRLEPDEWADDAAEQAVHAQVAGHGHQTQAGTFVADHGAVIHLVVAIVEVAGAVIAPEMA